MQENNKLINEKEELQQKIKELTDNNDKKQK